MAKFKIVQFSEIGTRCLSASRHFDECHLCGRVQRCELPEAKKGRIKLAEIRLAKARLKYENERTNFDKVIKENT